MQDTKNLAPTSEEKQWAMLCHLSAFAGWIIPFANLIAPLIIWQMKKQTMPFVDDQGKEALNFQITMFLASIAAAVLMFVFIGFILLPVLLIFQLVVVIMAGIKANEGITYRYPMTIRLLG